MAEPEGDEDVIDWDLALDEVVRDPHRRDRVAMHVGEVALDAGGVEEAGDDVPRVIEEE